MKEAILCNLGIGARPVFPDDYELVAEVSSDDVPEVYRLFNDIDGPWWTNEKVELLSDRDRVRSTSVGDVVELSNGRLFRFLGVGLEEI